MLQPFQRSCRLLVVGLTLFLVPGDGRAGPGAQDPAPDGPRRAAAEPEGLLERVAVLGASVSNGAGLRLDLRADCSFADLFGQFLELPRPALDLSDFWFFTDPVGRGERLVQSALEADPTLVIAPDFLFWFGFGSGIADERRPARLERGLRLLERLEAPLLVGDFPDVSFALEGYSPLLRGPLIRPDMLPSDGVRAELNRRLGAWAAGRPEVTVLPLADFVERAQRGEELEVRGHVWPAGSFERFLQQDRLHPNLEGAIALGCLLFDTLLTAHPELEEQLDIELDPEAVRERVMAATEPARRAREERARQREERRRGRGDEAPRMPAADGGAVRDEHAGACARK